LKSRDRQDIVSVILEQVGNPQLRALIEKESHEAARRARR
jgi:hypothetical protein